jgi:hypothetical protein
MDTAQTKQSVPVRASGSHSEVWRASLPSLNSSSPSPPPSPLDQSTKPSSSLAYWADTRLIPQ